MAKCQMVRESKSAATIRRKRKRIPALTELLSYRHKSATGDDNLDSDDEDDDIRADELVTGPPVLRLIMSSERTLFLGLLAFRIINALFIQTSFVPDEYWQSMEIAHNMTFGYGYLTWEWKTGLRGYSYPLLFAVIYKVLAILHLDNRILLIKLPKLLQGAFAAISDLFLYKFSRKLSGQKAAQWSLICQLTSWFTFYCCTRTLTNSMESVLTTVAMYYFPWPRRTKKAHWKYIALVGLCVVVRPTAAIVWLPMCAWHIWMWRNVAWKVIKLFAEVGFLILTVSSIVDRIFYGDWVYVQYNFLKFNALSNMAAFYGTHPWHWYLTQGFPVIMGTQIFPFVMAARRNKETICLGVIAWTILVYSCLGHKEFRFLLPILPLAMHVCGTYMAFMNGELPEEVNEDDYDEDSDIKDKQSDEEQEAVPAAQVPPVQRGPVSCKRFMLIFLIVTNMPLAIYTGLLHQRGTIDVTKYIADESSQVTNKTMSALFLMPCHSTPYYSYIHKNISLRFLTCEPNLAGQQDYLDQADIFYQNPQGWLDREYGVNFTGVLPTHLAMFDELQPKLNNFTKTYGYVDCAKFFHTHVPEGRVSGHVIVMCSSDWIVSQTAFNSKKYHKIERSNVDLHELHEEKKKKRKLKQRKQDL